MARKYNEASFLSTNAVESIVKGKKENFYPVSVGMAFRLKTLAEPLGLALASVFKTDTKNDVGRKEIISPTDSGPAMQTTIDPVSLPLAQFRAAQTSGAVADFMRAIAGEDTQRMLADLIMDSMRDYEKISVDDFLKITPLDAIPEQVAGVVKANQGVFGPLAQRLSTAFGDVKNKVVEHLTNKAKASVAEVLAKAETVAQSDSYKMTVPVEEVPTPPLTPVPSAT